MVKREPGRTKQGHASLGDKKLVGKSSSLLKFNNFSNDSAFKCMYSKAQCVCWLLRLMPRNSGSSIGVSDVDQLRKELLLFIDAGKEAGEYIPTTLCSA